MAETWDTTPVALKAGEMAGPLAAESDEMMAAHWAVPLVAKKAATSTLWSAPPLAVRWDWQRAAERAFHSVG
jgi:hypothetical protein